MEGRRPPLHELGRFVLSTVSFTVVLCSGDGKLLQARERCWDGVMEEGRARERTDEEKFPLNEIICYILPLCSLSLALKHARASLGPSYPNSETLSLVSPLESSSRHVLDNSRH